jgi:hypothetical protein
MAGTLCSGLTDGCMVRAAQLVPNLYGSVPNRARKRTVFEAMTELRWVRHIRGAITVAVLAEYFRL